MKHRNPQARYFLELLPWSDVRPVLEAEIARIIAVLKSGGEPRWGEATLNLPDQRCSPSAAKEWLLQKCHPRASAEWRQVVALLKGLVIMPEASLMAHYQAALAALKPNALPNPDLDRHGHQMMPGPLPLLGPKGMNASRRAWDNTLGPKSPLTPVSQVAVLSPEMAPKSKPAPSGPLSEARVKLPEGEPRPIADLLKHPALRNKSKARDVLIKLHNAKGRPLSINELAQTGKKNKDGTLAKPGGSSWRAAQKAVASLLAPMGFAGIVPEAGANDEPCWRLGDDAWPLS